VNFKLRPIENVKVKLLISRQIRGVNVEDEAMPRKQKNCLEVLGTGYVCWMCGRIPCKTDVRRWDRWQKPR